MRPGQLRTKGQRFITRRVMNWKRLVELSHVAQVGRGEPATELRREPPRQVVQHSLPVRGALRSALLVLDNQPSDLPVGLHHRRVDGAIGPGARRFEDSPNLPIQRLGGASERDVGGFPFRHQTPSISNIRRWKSSSMSLRCALRIAVGRKVSQKRVPGCPHGRQKLLPEPPERPASRSAAGDRRLRIGSFSAGSTPPRWRGQVAVPP